MLAQLYGAKMKVNLVLPFLLIIVTINYNVNPNVVINKCYIKLTILKIQSFGIITQTGMLKLELELMF